MNTYLNQVDIFDKEYFPDGVNFQLAPITLYGGTKYANYLTDAFRDLQKGYIFEFSDKYNNIIVQEYNITKIVAHKGEQEIILDKENGIVNSPQIIEGDTNIEFIALEDQNCDWHPNRRWMAFEEEIIHRAISENLQIIMHTNDDIIYNALRIAVKEGTLKPSDVIIYYFATGRTLATDYAGDIIHLDVNGTASDYPEGFLDTYTNQMFRLL